MTLRMVPARGGSPPTREPQKSERRLPQLGCLAALAGLLWLAAALLYHETRPTYGPATLILPVATPRHFDYPFHLRPAPRTPFLLLQELDLPRFHPTTFVFYPQDFLRAVSVNGHEIHSPTLPLSGASKEGRSIDLAPFLHPGVNQLTLQMEVRWGEANFNLAVSPWDNIYLALTALTIGAAAATSAFLYRLVRASVPLPEAILLITGVGLRYIYFVGTPFFVRSFDSSGHTDYLDYVSQHFGLPPPNAGWEAFQPPLYYIIVGSITKLLLFLGMAASQRFVMWQAISLLFSVGLLGAGYTIAGLLYEKGDRRRLYLLAVLAVAPPLVFNAARVSNDGLIALLAYIWLALLLSYWRQPGKLVRAWLALVLGLALLAKANAIALAGITVACLLLDRRFAMRSRIVSIVLMLSACAAISGWYYLPRALHAGEVSTYLVGNLHSLDPRAHIHHVFIKSIVFNPFKIIRYPFDDPWGTRGDHFLEVFFKTLLLGEWIKGESYKFLARWMMIIALLLIPPFVIGLYHAVRRRAVEEWPLLFTLTVVFLSQWLFLQCAPYLSTQDIRYSVVMLVPITYFLLQGIYRGAHSTKVIATFLLQLALLNSAIYLVTLSLGD